MTYSVYCSKKSPVENKIFSNNIELSLVTIVKKSCNVLKTSRALIRMTLYPVMSCHVMSCAANIFSFTAVRGSINDLLKQEREYI